MVAPANPRKTVLDGRTARLETALAASSLPDETKAALLDLQQRCNEHPESALPLIKRGYDRHLNNQMELAASGLAENYVEDCDPPLIYNNLMGRAARVTDREVAGEVQFHVEQHTEASLRTETGGTAYWATENRQLDPFVKLGSAGEGGDQPTPEGVRDTPALLPHGEVKLITPRKGEPYWALTGPGRGHPNASVVASLLADKLHGAPTISAVRRHPALLPGLDALAMTDGYHAALKVELVMLPPIALMTLEDALAELALTYGRFCYATPADWAAALSMLLALIIAPAAGMRPLFLVDKTRPRTGATLLAESVCIGITGAGPTKVGPPEREDSEETGKSLSASAAASQGGVLLDNFDRRNLRGGRAGGIHHLLPGPQLQALRQKRPRAQRGPDLAAGHGHGQRRGAHRRDGRAGYAHHAGRPDSQSGRPAI